MSAHIDPASPAFERLSRSQQAWVYRYQHGWKVTALMDEFGVSERTIQYWTTPGTRERMLKRKRKAHTASKHQAGEVA